jgi:hypothetical protein
VPSSGPALLCAAAAGMFAGCLWPVRGDRAAGRSGDAGASDPPDVGPGEQQGEDDGLPSSARNGRPGAVGISAERRPGRAKPGHVPSARDNRVRRLRAEVFAKIDFR